MNLLLKELWKMVYICWCYGQQSGIFFNVLCYASTVCAVILCPSICPSITSRCSVKTTKHRITQTMPYDSPGTCQRSQRNSNGI